MRGWRLINDLTQTFNLNFEVFANNDVITCYMCRYFADPLYIYCHANWCAYYQENFLQRFYYKDIMRKAWLKQYIAEQLIHECCLKAKNHMMI